jgi:hypothetical protein
VPDEPRVLVRRITHILCGHKPGAMDPAAAVGLLPDENAQSGFLPADRARKVSPRIGTSRDGAVDWERDQRTSVGWIRWRRLQR